MVKSNTMVINLFIFLLTLVCLGVMFVTDTDTPLFVFLGLTQVCLTYILSERGMSKTIPITCISFGLIYIVALITTEILSPGFIISIIGLLDILLTFNEEVKE